MVIKVTVITGYLSLLLIGCSGSNNSEHEDYGDANFPQQPIEVNYSNLFRIDTLDGFQILKITDPVTDMDHEFTLVPKGMKGPSNGTVIYTPVSDLSLFSVSFIGFLDALSSLDRIKYIENINYVYNPSVRDDFDKGLILESGLFGQLNLEKLILDSPELMLLNDFPESSDYMNKLLKSGIRILPILEWQEQDPLARAEWIKVFGALLDKEKEAEGVFAGVEEEYNKVKSQAQTDTIGEKVLFSAMYEGVWYMPGGNSYVAHLLRDANGSYAWQNSIETGSVSLSFEEVVLTSLQNDVWINPDACSLEEIYRRDGRYQKFVNELSLGVYQACKRVSANGGNDYWESGVVRPDIILKDYVNMLDSSVDDKGLHYFRKLD